MFKHAFHAGQAVEVLTVSGKNPLEKWKTTGTINKTFDSQMKGYIFTLDGQSKISLPKDEKETLGLIQPFIVFQIFIPLGKNLHIEIGITDSSKARRRLIFHSGAKEIVANPLHARIPINQFRRNQWVNLSLDISTFTRHCFKSVQYRSIDFLEVTASCKLRRIFTMKNPLFDDQQDEDIELAQMINQMMAEELRENMPFEYAPSNLGFPQSFLHFNQLIFPHRLKMNSTSSVLEENINQTNNNAQQKVQLAFGQRVGAGAGKSGGFGSKISSNTASTLNNHPTNENNKNVIVGSGVSKQSDKGNQQKSNTLSKNIRRNSDLSANQKAPLQKKQNQDILEEEEDEELKNDNQINHQDEYVDRLEDQDDLDDEPIDYNWRRKDEKSKSPIRKVTKEDLKEQEHFLYLQNQSDEEDQTKTQTISKQKQQNTSQTKSKQTSNPWDIAGRQNHDNKTAYVQSQDSKLQGNAKQNQPRTQQQFNSRQHQQQKQQQQMQTTSSQQSQNSTFNSSNKKSLDKSPSAQPKQQQQSKPVFKRDRSSNKKVSFIEEKKKLQDEDAGNKTQNDFESLKQQIAQQSNSKLALDEKRRQMIFEKDEEDDNKFSAEKIRKLNPYEYTKELMEEMKNSNSPKNALGNNDRLQKQASKAKQNVMPFKPKLKRDHDDEDEEQNRFNRMAKGSKYNNFNLESWGRADNDADDFRNNKNNQGVDESIEEAFDVNHDNLMNYFNNNQYGNAQKPSDIAQSRKSKEYKENPMNNGDFDQQRNNTDEDDMHLPTEIEYDHSRYESRQNTQDTTRMYSKLESSRKEERRPFSPPFKLPGQASVQNNVQEYVPTELLSKINSQVSDDMPNLPLNFTHIPSDNSDLVKIGSKTSDQPDTTSNKIQNQSNKMINQLNQDQVDTNKPSDFDKQLEYLKVQRADILRDSLDQTVPKPYNRDSQIDLPSRATVQNENGDLLEVIYDPVLKCFYDPRTNNYYELKYQ